MPLTSQSFYQSSQHAQQQQLMGTPNNAMQERLSVGVLKQSAKQNVRKQYIAQKTSAQLEKSHTQRY